MKKLYVTALMVGAVIIGLLLVGCADDTDNDKSVTSTFQASRVWNRSGGAVLERSAITENKLTIQDIDKDGFSKVVLTVNGLTQANGTMVTLVGGGNGKGLYPEDGDFTGDGFGFVRDESTAGFPSSFQKTIANKSVSFTFYYQATDLSNWSSSSTFAKSDVPREVAFRLEESETNGNTKGNYIFTAEESSDNYYIGGVGEYNTATLTINLGGSKAYNLSTVEKSTSDFTATYAAGAATDNGGNIKIELNVSGIDTGLANAELAVAGTNLRYAEGTGYSNVVNFDDTPGDDLRCTISAAGTCALAFYWDPDDADSAYGDGTWDNIMIPGTLLVFKINLITDFSSVQSFVYPANRNQYFVTTDSTPDHTSGIYGGNATIDEGDTITFAVSLGD